MGKHAVGEEPLVVPEGAEHESMSMGVSPVRSQVGLGAR